MALLEAHQRAFVAAVLSGPEACTGADMAAAHRHLEAGNSDFDGLVGHVLDTLAGLGITTDVLRCAAQRLEPLRGDVVTVPYA